MPESKSAGLAIGALLLMLGSPTTAISAERAAVPVQDRKTGAVGIASPAGDRDSTRAREIDATKRTGEAAKKGGKTFGSIFFDLKEQDPDGFLSPPD